MEPNLEKIDEAVLALLHLTRFGEDIGRQKGEYQIFRTWKGHDWSALNRLHEKGMISNPVGTAKSVVMTEEGVKRAEELFQRLFCA